MIKAVLDTNIFISALFWRGAPYRVVEQGLGGAFIIVTSQGIIQETGRTLTQKFEFPLEDTREFLKTIVLSSYVVSPTERLRVVKADPDDDKIIECAVAGDARFIVSGDRHLLDIEKYRSIVMISPQDFLKRLSSWIRKLKNETCGAGARIDHVSDKPIWRATGSSAHEKSQPWFWWCMQYYVTRTLGAVLVSFDKDFDRTDIKRVEPVVVSWKWGHNLTYSPSQPIASQWAKR